MDNRFKDSYNKSKGVHHGKTKEVLTRIQKRSSKTRCQSRAFIFSHAARETGASTATIRDWVLRINGNPRNPTTPALTPEAIELTKLRKEMKIL